MTTPAHVSFNIGIPFKDFRGYLKQAETQPYSYASVTENAILLLAASGFAVQPLWDWVETSKRAFKVINMLSPDILDKDADSFIPIAKISLDPGTAIMFKLTWQGDPRFLIEQTRL